MGSVLLAVILLAMAVFGYFLPTFVAVRRSHKNENAIFVLNLLAGWSILGWIVALVWAYAE